MNTSSRRWRNSDSPVLRAFARSRTVQIAAFLLLLIAFASIFAPWIARQNPFDPANLDLIDAFTPPWSEGVTGAFYPLGADDQGRDVFSAILYGLRMSMLVGVSAIALSVNLVADWLRDALNPKLQRARQITSPCSASAT